MDGLKLSCQMISIASSLIAKHIKRHVLKIDKGYLRDVLALVCQFITMIVVIVY